MSRLVQLLKRMAAFSSRLQHPIARAAVACVVVIALAGVGFEPRRAAELPVQQPAASVSAPVLYAQIFALQERQDFKAADELLTQLPDDTLLGYVLAQRYQNPAYKVTAAELATWLANYSDHPQAADMLSLAKRSGVEPQALASIATGKPALQGAGYATHLGRSSMPDRWYEGLRLWKERNYAKAEPIFTAISKNDDLNDWQRAAGAYWAYRALDKQDKTRAANRALANAAQFPNTFYGMLATTKRGESMVIRREFPHVASALWTQGPVLRARMLAAMDREDEAETEIRRAYSNLEASQRPSLITVAALLNLSNLQLRLAQAETNNDSADVVNYPLPRPMITAQNQVNPALLLAVARQESSFRKSVRSESGATGIMQMMPSTAQHVLRGSTELNLADNGAEPITTMHERLNDMAMSAKIGAAYFTMLKRQPAVGNNLMRLLAAYNAGPGTVAMWQSAAKQMNDPLLYMESIPYPETHNYVMQVMAHYWIYQSLLGENPRSLKQLANGQWPTV